MKISAHLSAVIALSLIATPVLAQRQQQQNESAATKAAGPAPRRDISGHWLGPVSPRKEPPPPMTALGQQLFAATKPFQGPRAVPIAQANDPLVTCNPLGFPRSALFETRGFAFEHVPRRTLQLLQYQRIWREIWTDGRPLPVDPQPSWNGYSSGKWEGDTLVIETNGFRDDLWMDMAGTPLTQAARVTERFRRPSFGTLEIDAKVNDPQAYTKPWSMKLVQRIVLDVELIDEVCLENEKSASHMKAR